MSAAAQYEIDAEAVMQRLRSEYARIDAEVAATARGFAADKAADDLELPRLPESAGDIVVKRDYHLADLLQFHDHDFVANAYRAILRREPDSEGFRGYLDGLRAGEMAKTVIVGSIRYSEEGRAAGVRVRGLRLAYALRRARRIPVLGRLLGIVQYVLRLPDIVRNHERLEATVTHRYFDTNRRVNAAEAAVEQAILRLNRQTANRFAALAGTSEQREHSSQRRLGALESTVASELEQLRRTTGDRSDAFDVELDGVVARMATQRRVEQLAHDLDAARSELASLEHLRTDAAALRQEFQGKLAAMSVALEYKADGERLTMLANGLVELVAQKAERGELATQSEAADQRLRQLAAGIEAVENSKADRAQLQSLIDAASDLAQRKADAARSLDGLYASFEERFRGGRNEIRLRAEIYVPVVRAAGAGATDAPILDLGCGRGEWLELLKGQNLDARGVDINAVTVAEGRRAGLDVAEGDAVDYLHGLESETLGAVTGFHVIEHLPFERLVLFMDEILRVLRPGGVAILETPNPENVIVGAHTFYLDPTHERPIPPTMLHFLAEARGFSSVDVVRLHPYPREEQVKEGHPAIADFINGMFFGPRDYAVIAHK